MNIDTAIFTQSWGIILLFNVIFTIIFVIFAIINFFKIRKFTKKYDNFMKAGFDGKNIEKLIDACIFSSQDAIDKSTEIQKSINKIEANMMKSIQKIGLVRFSAFDDVGGDQSFSVAFLDSLDDGIVISGIYSRDNSSVYVKSIRAGTSKNTLTAEEIQAIDKARRLFGQRVYSDITKAL